MTESVAVLRQRLDQLDRELLALVAERQSLVAEIGARKHQAGQPLRDFARERVVIEKGRANAQSLGLSRQLAQDVLERLIHHSLVNQERLRLAAAAQGAGRRALVIGGLGRMGNWMARFLHAQGFEVEIVDPAAGDSPFPRLPDLDAAVLDHDVLVVAAPLRASDRILRDLARRRPSGLIFDVGSLKQPLAGALAELRAQGCLVASVHPMFGPDVVMLSGHHVLFVDTGVAEAMDAARGLFADTMAECVTVSLAEHDAVMAWVLGLSHLLNVAFAVLLGQHPDHARLLRRLSGSTFARQLELATAVASENPSLYYEIQHLNPAGSETVTAFSDTLSRLAEHVRAGDETAFTAAMRQAHQALSATTEDQIDG